MIIIRDIRVTVFLVLIREVHAIFHGSLLHPTVVAFDQLGRALGA